MDDKLAAHGLVLLQQAKTLRQAEFQIGLDGLQAIAVEEDVLDLAGDDLEIDVAAEADLAGAKQIVVKLQTEARDGEAGRGEERVTVEVNIRDGQRLQRVEQIVQRADGPGCGVVERVALRVLRGLLLLFRHRIEDLLEAVVEVKAPFALVEHEAGVRDVKLACAGDKQRIEQRGLAAVEALRLADVLAGVDGGDVAEADLQLALGKDQVAARKGHGVVDDGRFGRGVHDVVRDILSVAELADQAGDLDHHAVRADGCVGLFFRRAGSVSRLLRGFLLCRVLLVDFRDVGLIFRLVGEALELVRGQHFPHIRGIPRIVGARIQRRGRRDQHAVDF